MPCGTSGSTGLCPAQVSAGSAEKAETRSGRKAY